MNWDCVIINILLTYLLLSSGPLLWKSQMCSCPLDVIFIWLFNYLICSSQCRKKYCRIFKVEIHTVEPIRTLNMQLFGSIQILCLPPMSFNPSELQLYSDKYFDWLVLVPFVSFIYSLNRWYSAKGLFVLSESEKDQRKVKKITE